MIFFRVGSDELSDEEEPDDLSWTSDAVPQAQHFKRRRRFGTQPSRLPRFGLPKLNMGLDLNFLHASDLTHAATVEGFWASRHESPVLGWKEGMQSPM